MEWSSAFIVLQAGPSLGDFMRQLPVGLIVLMCGTGLLLLIALTVIIRARAQRKAPPPMPNHPYVPVSGAVRSTSAPAPTVDHDLPDLDLLVSAPPVPAAPRPAPTETPPARAARKDIQAITLSGGETARAVEVVTILRDVEDGGLIIQMGDRVYRDLSSDETFRGGFLKIMRELTPLVTQAPRKATAPLKDEAPVQAAEAAQPPAEPASSLRDLLNEGQIERPKPRPSTPPPPISTEGTMPGDLPRYSLDDKPQVIKKRTGLLGRTKTEFVPVPDLNLAQAIEAYLQHKLKYTDDFAGRTVHVHPAPDGGVSIEVDGEFFDSVGDVRDAQVRAFLAETIQEWQQRNTGS
jgi:hypothetical protein